MEREWNQEAYDKQKAICQKLTNKGLLLALNQVRGMTEEAAEAYRDTLRERLPETYHYHFNSPSKLHTPFER